MSEMTLEEFLKPLSESLGHAEVPDRVDKGVDPGRGMGREKLAALGTAELVAWFTREAQAIKIALSEARPETLADAVLAQIRAFDGKSVVYADDPQADACGLPQAFEGAGLEALRWDEASGPQSVEACKHADVGVTFPWAGIASTATVAQPCDARCGRSVSLLPMAHIAVVKTSSLVPHMIDVLERLDALPPDELPSSLTFITGPSATADIELVSVVGVHGPMRTAVILLDS